MENESFYETGFGVLYVYKFLWNYGIIEGISCFKNDVLIISFLKETYMKY